MDPSNLDEAGDATLIAKLENGTKLKARLHGYSERGIAVKRVFEDFKKKYITPMDCLPSPSNPMISHTGQQPAAALMFADKQS